MKNKILKHLADNEIDKAISALSEKLDTKDNVELKNTLIDIERNYNQLKQKELNNLISNEELSREFSKVTKRILELNKLQDSGAVFMDENLPQDKFCTKNSTMRISVIAVLIFMAIATFIYSPVKDWLFKNNRKDEKTEIKNEFGSHNKVEQEYKESIQEENNAKIQNTFKDSNTVIQKF